jgi:hypothetical protein
VALEPFAGFRPFPARHDETGAMRHVYQVIGTDVSEALLFGLGAGAGFGYRHLAGALPSLTGRATNGRAARTGLQRLAGHRTGVDVASATTVDPRLAEARLLAALRGGRPVTIRLPRSRSSECGVPPASSADGLVAAVVGYDAPSGLVLVCGLEPEPCPTHLAALASAQASERRPFPPCHRLWTFDARGQHEPRPGEVRDALADAAAAMLEPRRPTTGVTGIRTAASALGRWPDHLPGTVLAVACRQAEEAIETSGGPAGGLFRHLYADFLDEAMGITGDLVLHRIAGRVHAIGDRWQEAARLFGHAAGAERPEADLAVIASLLREVADREKAVWHDVFEVAWSTPAPR